MDQEAAMNTRAASVAVRLFTGESSWRRCVGGWGPLEPGHTAIVMPVKVVTGPGPIATTFARAAWSGLDPHTAAFTFTRIGFVDRESSALVIESPFRSDPARQWPRSSFAVRVRTPRNGVLTRLRRSAPEWGGANRRCLPRASLPHW